MASFVQTIHASANGISLVEAADYAAMKTLLSLGTMADQAANSVNIDGGAIDGTTIGASAAAAATFTTSYAGSTGAGISATGVKGHSNSGYGAEFLSVSSYAVYAESASGYGMWCKSTDSYGLRCDSVNGIPAYFYRNTTGVASPVVSARQDHASGTGTAGNFIQDGSGYIIDGYVGDTERFHVANTGELAIISDTVGVKFGAAGGQTIYSNGTNIMFSGGDIDANGSTIFFGAAENEAAINATPSPNTCTVNLGAENHWTIPANDADDAINATITMPPGPCAGTILIEQGATPRDITWLAGSGTIAWLGTEPTWNDASEANEFHAVSWRWNGTYLFLSDAGKTSITP